MSPQLRLPDRCLCEKHYRRLIPREHPSGASWEFRYTYVMVMIGEMMLNDPEIRRKCGDQFEVLASAIISQHIPLCCHLGERAMNEVAAALDRNFPDPDV